MEHTITRFENSHVDYRSTKHFEATVRDLQAELGRASTGELMEWLATSDSWEQYAERCKAAAGHSNLIEVGHLNWGNVLTLSGTAMKARCFIIGNPLAAQKLLAAGGPEVGLYLPTKIFVFEHADGTVHISYDSFTPIMAGFGIEALGSVAKGIDGILENLAVAAAG